MRYSERCVSIRPHKNSQRYCQDFEVIKYDPDDDIGNITYQTDTQPILSNEFCKISIDWDDRKIYLKCIDNKGNILIKKTLKNKVATPAVLQPQEPESEES